MNLSDRQFWLDFQSARYLAALERNDFDTQAELWELAATDPELIAELHLVHDDLLAEEQERIKGTLAEAVERHLPSAEVIRPTTGPVTVGMVADELFRHTPDKLSAAAHQLNDRLRQATVELPAELGLSKLIAWAEAQFGTAEPRYWKAFREAALRLELRAAAEVEYQLAARQSPEQGGRK